jgi:RNA polymerase sigma factor (sigma-70 family)
MLRKVKVRKEVSLQDSWDDDEGHMQFEADVENPLDRLTKEEFEACLEQALDRLSMKPKEALILKRFSGFSYEEIADLVGCSTSAVKMRVSRALNQLAKYMSEYKNEQRA